MKPTQFTTSGGAHTFSQAARTLRITINHLRTMHSFLPRTLSSDSTAILLSAILYIFVPRNLISLSTMGPREVSLRSSLPSCGFGISQVDRVAQRWKDEKWHHFEDPLGIHERFWSSAPGIQHDQS
ncbi:hypothetical protein Vi05172_g10102 [Venturia inaequalis]|nr:hypothetical protein Vi05172_g10102 [Venturia inaequalis]